MKKFNVKRRVIFMVLWAMFITSTAWGFEFNFDYTNVVSLTSSKSLFSPARPTMFRVADPVTVSEPFQDAYGTINIPLGWVGPLTVHIRMVYVNDTPKIAKFTGLIPTSWTTAFWRIASKPWGDLSKRPDLGLFWYTKIQLRQDVVLQPNDRQTVPFVDLYLGRSFDYVPEVTYGGFARPGAYLQVGDSTWTDPQSICMKFEMTSVPVTPVVPDISPSVTIVNFATAPSDVGQNNVEVEVDIKPGDGISSINRQSNGVIPVKILYGTSYNVYDIDPASVMFAGTFPVKWDFCNDGLILYYDTQRCAIPNGATSLGITGRMLNGDLIYGSDLVRIVK